MKYRSKAVHRRNHDHDQDIFSDSEIFLHASCNSQSVIIKSIIIFLWKHKTTLIEIICKSSFLVHIKRSAEDLERS